MDFANNINWLLSWCVFQLKILPHILVICNFVLQFWFSIKIIRYFWSLRYENPMQKYLHTGNEVLIITSKFMFFSLTTRYFTIESHEINFLKKKIPVKKKFLSPQVRLYLYNQESAYRTSSTCSLHHILREHLNSYTILKSSYIK